MSKMYLLMSGCLDYEDCFGPGTPPFRIFSVIGIYSSKENAEKVRDKLLQHIDYRIIEREVDQYLDLPEDKRYYLVMNDYGPHFSDAWLVHGKEDNYFENGRFYCWAKSPDQARWKFDSFMAKNDIENELEEGIGPTF